MFPWSHWSSWYIGWISIELVITVDLLLNLRFYLWNLWADNYRHLYWLEWVLNFIPPHYIILFLWLYRVSTMNLRLYYALCVILIFILLLAQFWLTALSLSCELIHILTIFCYFCQMMPLLGYMFMLGKQAGGSILFNIHNT